MKPNSFANDAEVRWLDALDAACAGRTREAVVAARASVEIAWLDTVTAASAQHRAISPASVHPVIDAYLALANEGRRSIHDKLGDYSLKILGVSFVATWQARGRWKDLLDAFTTRNDAAHGRASITPARAAEIVALMRELLDEIAVERAKYP